MTKRKIEIIAWEKHHFAYAIEKKVKEGWSLSHDNKGTPEGYPGFYRCEMTQGIEQPEIKIEYGETELLVPEDPEPIVLEIQPEPVFVSAFTIVEDNPGDEPEKDAEVNELFTEKDLESLLASQVAPVQAEPEKVETKPESVNKIEEKKHFQNQPPRNPVGRPKGR